MTQQFETALAVVLGHEGGFVNDPKDAGGATNMGITFATFEKYLGFTPTLDQLRLMSRATAATIYRDLYWAPLKLDAVLSLPLAVSLFDQGVLTGITNTIERLQKVLNVTIDGILGDATLSAINREPAKRLTLKFLQESMCHYVRIVTEKPDQVRFLRGWLDRVFDLIVFATAGNV